MKPYFKQYPAFKYDAVMDEEYKIPNTYFKIIDLNDKYHNEFTDRIHDSDFKIDIYTDQDTKDVYSIKSIMKQDYKNYFLFLQKNGRLTDATLIAETTHNPYLQISSKEKYYIISVYDYRLGRKYLRQKVIVDFTAMTIVYEKILIRT